MEQSPKETLIRLLKANLPDGCLLGVEDGHFDTLIGLGCTNLIILAAMPAQDLRNAGIPLALVRVLECYGLIGEHWALSGQFNLQPKKNWTQLG